MPYAFRLSGRPLAAALTLLALGTLAAGATAAPPPPPRPAPPSGPTSLQTGTSPGPAPAVFAVPGATGAAADPHRWTDETPDAMVDDLRARALSETSTDADVAASLLTLEALDGRATYPRARSAVHDVAEAERTRAGKAPHAADLAAIASLLERALSPDEGTDAGALADAKLGVLTNLALLGPFRDTGGGLRRKEGPEAPGASFGDMRARYGLGTIDVAWRQVPRHYAGAHGVPLDVFVYPRKESCSLVASEITTRTKGPFAVYLAATGSVRLMLDGVELGRSEDVHSSAKLDRMAFDVDVAPGEHLLAAKVCTGALDDDGRVRLRVADASGAPLDVSPSAVLRDPPPHPKVAFRRHETPLDRALAAGGKGPDADLDGIVARVTGGADDLKSPRAPGMLDTLTRAKDLSADRLAMAGWIAPSGANRSGWLNLARDRAALAGDARTRTFVERRLMAEHIAARMPDWAMAVEGAAKLDRADAEAQMLRALAYQGLGTDALRAQALAILAREADAAPSTVPSALLEELAQLAGPLSPARELSARRLLEKRGQGGLDLVNACASESAASVAKAATSALQDAGIADLDEGVSVASAVAHAGDHAAARAAYARLVEWGPNVAAAWAGLADEIAARGQGGAHGEGPGKDDSVSAALRRARALSPGEARYRAELSLHAGDASSLEGREDERYLVPSQTILARRQGVPQGLPDVADRELYWMRAVVMHPDRRVSQLIQYAREIVIAPRTEDELLEDIPAEGELTEILRARVHRKDGGTAFPTEEHNEGTRPRIRWPELLPGDTVEVAVRTWTGGAVGGRSDPPFYFLDYSGAQQTHPLLYNEVVVDAPSAFPIHVDTLHGAPDRMTEKDENGRHITHVIWDRPPTFADEPLAPALSEHVPMTVGSTFKSWADFRAWYTEAVRDFTVPDAEVKRLAAELVRNKTTRADKLRAIFNFVADDIRYVNYTSGEAWLPNRPQQLLARREGDCDDKAILLITLLRAIGVDAQEVLLQTRDTGQPSLILAKNAAIPMFDHGIAFLPGPGGGTYLDATSPQSRLGPLPSMDARAVAFKIDSGPAEIVRLPSSSPKDHGSVVHWTLTLHPDGSGDLDGEETHKGDGAFWLRTYLTEEGSSRAQYVENNLVGNWLSSVDVDKKVDFKGDLPGGEAWIRYRAHSDDLARHEQGELVIPLAQNGSLAMQLAPLVERTLPVSLGSTVAPSEQTRTTRIKAPPGFAFHDLPPGGDENGGEFGRAHLEVARDPKDPRSVVVLRTLIFDESVIPVDRYKPWREWLQRVDALMHKSVRLVPDVRAQ